jgi:hypothetical protein
MGIAEALDDIEAPRRSIRRRWRSTFANATSIASTKRSALKHG